MEKDCMLNEKRESIRNILKQDVPEAIEHGIFVSKIAGLIAKELQLPDEEIYEIKLAGIVHDIGKIRLAGYLYGRENDTLLIEEMKYVRMHSKLSYEILKEKEFSEYILQSVLHHHENFDGSGYPDNLVSEEIPYGARILRVTDVFVALVSDRPYRKAFDIKTALELMIDEVKNFDMKIFLAFQRVVNDIDIEKIMTTKVDK